MQQAHAALAAARAREAQRIADALRVQHVVGVLGEAEVGKTRTIRQTLNTLDSTAQTIYLDLDGAASDEHIGFLMAKQIARMMLGHTDLSLLSGGVLLPGRVERGRLRLTEVLGIDGMEESRREWPSGRYASTAAFRGLEALAEQRDLILWIDHVEAPHVTPRHPVKTDRLLWDIRELSQRRPRLRIVVSGRNGVQQEIVGPLAAFHQHGQWLSIDAPSPGTWMEVASRLGTPTGTAQELATLTGGHPQTMLLALMTLKGADGGWPSRAGDVLGELAAHDDGLAARAIQHARSLHRLGWQLLIQIARSQRPYAAAQRGSATPQEISKVLNRLRLAGLLRHPDGWALVNPLVAIRLRGTVHEPPNADAPDDSAL